MAGNSFGNVFKLTTFGESHGLAIGGVIDGCPAGISIDFDAIQREMDRRKPGQSKIVTQRKEPDTVNNVDGLFIETHFDPANAKSDGANMLHLDNLEKLLTNLVAIRKTVNNF